MINTQHICSKTDCNNIAVWCYMPASEDNPYYCEEHISRGCSCNTEHNGNDWYEEPKGIEGKDYKWIEKDIEWTPLDEQGREYPCCEYEYDENGFRKDFGEYDMSKQIIEFIKSKKKNTYLYNEFITVYVRNSFNLIENTLQECIDIGNISIKEEYQNIGIFSEFIDCLKFEIEKYNFFESKNLCIFVQSILNPIVEKVLNKHDFKRTPGVDNNMYIKW